MLPQQASASFVHTNTRCDFLFQIGSWHFDKRDFEASYPPKNYELPTKCRAKAMVRVVEMINEATAHIPNWG